MVAKARSLTVMPVVSQSDDFSVRFVSTVDGMPDRNVQYISQDSEGLMWLAGFKSVTRYDGYHFESVDVYLEALERVNGCHSDNAGGIILTTNTGRVMQGDIHGFQVVDVDGAMSGASCLKYLNWRGQHWMYDPLSGEVRVYDSAWSLLAQTQLNTSWSSEPHAWASQIALHPEGVVVLADSSTLVVLDSTVSVKSIARPDQEVFNCVCASKLQAES